MIDSSYKRLPPIPAECFDLPDYELGALLLYWWTAAQAEASGINVRSNDQVYQAYGERIVELTRQLPDDNGQAQHDSLLLALRLAANGKFEEAGKKLKGYMSQMAEHMAFVKMASNMDKDTARGFKVRLGAQQGHEIVNGDAVSKEVKRRKYLDALDEIRLNSPKASNRKVYEIAEAQSMELFGEKVSYKTFERAEKKEKS